MNNVKRISSLICLVGSIPFFLYNEMIKKKVKQVERNKIKEND